MGFLESLRQLLGRSRTGQPKGSGGGRSSFGLGDANVHWVYAKCGRCGEPLRARINLANDPSLSDDGTTWIVRKELVGSGANRCYQRVEVTLHFDAKKTRVIEAEAANGSLISAEEYQALMTR